MNDNLTLAWHFVSDTLRDGSPIPPDGEWLHHEGECRICESGLHASARAVDALRYAPGSTVCRVAMYGIEGIQNDKLVAQSRFILWRLDSETALRTFARQAALSIIKSWHAPKIVRRFLETGNEDLRSAAESAAWSAAESAAWSAAESAAHDRLNSTLESMLIEARGNPDDTALLAKVPRP